MKAITLHQPWATLVALGIKTIETRSWATRHRGRVVVHAAKKLPTPRVIGDWEVHRPGRREHYWRVRPTDAPWPQPPLPLGAVVATATIVDVLPMAMYVRSVDGERAHDNVLSIDRSIFDDRPTLLSVPDTDGGWRDVSDQLPYGDFEDGRFAWMLEDIQMVTPAIHTNGRQGLWTWEEPSWLN